MGSYFTYFIKVTCGLLLTHRWTACVYIVRIFTVQPFSVFAQFGRISCSWSKLKWTTFNRNIFSSLKSFIFIEWEILFCFNLVQRSRVPRTDSTIEYRLSLLENRLGLNKSPILYLLSNCWRRKLSLIYFSLSITLRLFWVDRIRSVVNILNCIFFRREWGF